MAAHRSLRLIAFFPPVINTEDVLLRFRTSAGDLLDLTFSRDLARKFGQELLAAANSSEIGPRTPPQTSSSSSADITCKATEGIARVPDEARRARHLAAAREWLALPEPRPVRKHWCEARGLTDSLLIIALQHEKDHPGQPWLIKKTGRGDQITPEQIAACRVVWHRYLADPSLKLTHLAAEVGITLSSMLARWSQFEQEPGSPVLKPSGKLR